MSSHPANAPHASARSLAPGAFDVFDCLAQPTDHRVLRGRHARPDPVDRPAPGTRPRSPGLWLAGSIVVAHL